MSDNKDQNSEKIGFSQIDIETEVNLVAGKELSVKEKAFNI